jgi:hypothetical protein
MSARTVERGSAPSVEAIAAARERDERGRHTKCAASPDGLDEIPVTPGYRGRKAVDAYLTETSA